MNHVREGLELLWQGESDHDSVKILEAEKVLVSAFVTDEPFAAYVLGKIEFSREGYVAALNYFRTSARLLEGFGKVNVADCYLAMNDFRKAGDTYCEILEGYPEDICARSGMAEVFYSNGRIESAVKEFESLIGEGIVTSQPTLRDLLVCDDECLFQAFSYESEKDAIVLSYFALLEHYAHADKQSRAEEINKKFEVFCKSI